MSISGSSISRSRRLLRKILQVLQGRLEPGGIRNCNSHMPIIPHQLLGMLSLNQGKYQRWHICPSDVSCGGYSQRYCFRFFASKFEISIVLYHGMCFFTHPLTATEVFLHEQFQYVEPRTGDRGILSKRGRYKYVALLIGWIQPKTPRQVV